MHPDLKPYLSPIALASYAIVIASLLLRPVYPKSILVGLFVGCVLIATYGTWICFEGWQRSTSIRQKGAIVALLSMFLGLSAWGGYMSLRDILR
ncbi:hypothetical protein CK228_25295 [Mesorhizobium sp. WSM4312]|nr:hypothetical protein CK228_25295 [Mesorhizobium sp. WSM4312]